MDWGRIRAVGRPAASPCLVTITVQLGNHNYPWFQRDKNWDKLRSDPEFQRIMHEVEGYWKHYQELFAHT